MSHNQEVYKLAWRMEKYDLWVFFAEFEMYFEGYFESLWWTGDEEKLYKCIYKCIKKNWGDVPQPGSV